MVDSFAARLQRLLERAQAAPGNPSRREIAREAGISPSYLNDLAAGRRPTPSMDVLERLARRLGTTPEYLWTGDRTVNAWAVLAKHPEYPVVSHPSRTRGDRYKWVVEHLALMYPGHLSVEDIAHETGISMESMEACLRGQWPPTDHQLEVLSELSGVPIRWLRFGDLTLPAFPDMPDVDSAVVAQYVDVMAFAARNRIPPKAIRAMLEAFLVKE